MRLWLKNLREEMRLNQQEIADRLDIDPGYYELLETGNLSLNIPVLLAAKLSDLFMIPISRLVIYEGEYKASENAVESRERLKLVLQSKHYK